MQMALSAAAPIFRGYLADVDCRWNVIAGSVDDRTPEELGLEVVVFPVVSISVLNYGKWEYLENLFFFFHLFSNGIGPMSQCPFCTHKQQSVD